MKLYRQSFPPKLKASRVRTFLAAIPDRNPNGNCGSAVCPLDDMRRKAPKLPPGTEHR